MGPQDGQALEGDSREVRPERGRQRPLGIAPPGNTLYTIGHSTRSLEGFVRLLKAGAVARVVDVRTVPRSRHNPQFNRDSLPDSLAGSGIAYSHEPGLGGLRHPQPESPNSGWRNASFRGYADYMQTLEFEQNLDKVIELAGRETIALMCAEAVPWRCHRSLIADALTVRGMVVEHIISDRSVRRHVMTSSARIEGERITYPAPASLL